MEQLNSYWLIIAACVVIIISYFFNQLARRTNVPSVLLLIILGILVNQINILFRFAPDLNLLPVLELLGIMGLILIVLEASLELKLTREKMGVIWRSLIIAIISIAVNSFLMAWVVKSIWVLDWYVSLIYVVPLSIMSSAIIIPSVQNLPEGKKEFLIYESVFSDILGIMLFYFLLEASEGTGSHLAWNISGTILLTIVVSFIVGYGLLFVFQKLKSGTKLFLLIAVLVLFYSIGKLFHLSSLLLILVFGVILSNHKLFVIDKIKKHFDDEAIKTIHSNFMLITFESSFIARTFFFLVFGLSISLVAVGDSKVILVSLAILSIIFILRYILIKMICRKSSFPEWQIAPRGLITILLFYSIPREFHINGLVEFEGVLFLVIMISSAIMALSMISYRKNQGVTDEDDLLNDDESPDDKRES